MADEYADLLAHEVDAAYGMVGADTEDGTVPAVRLLFHHGHDLERTRHSERFMAPEGLPGLTQWTFGLVGSRPNPQWSQGRSRVTDPGSMSVSFSARRRRRW